MMHSYWYEFHGVVKALTDKAMLMQLGEQDVWIPLSVGKWPDELSMGEEGAVRLPEWFVHEKDLEDEAE